MKKSLTGILSALLLSSSAQAVSYYAWSDLYEVWMPPTFTQQQANHRSDDQYPFDAPEAVLGTQAYDAIELKMNPKAHLLGDLSFFEAPMLPQSEVLKVRLGGEESFELTPDKEMMKEIHFPLEGVVKVDALGEFYLYWQVYVPLSSPLNAWVKQNLAQHIRTERLGEGTYDIEIYIP